jgi:hypothetical protein
MPTPVKSKEKPLTCSICFRPIPDKMGWKHGNNAEPINEGRCCDTCNNSVVIPARLNRAYARVKEDQ